MQNNTLVEEKFYYNILENNLIVIIVNKNVITVKDYQKYKLNNKTVEKLFNYYIVYFKINLIVENLQCFNLLLMP